MSSRPVQPAADEWTGKDVSVSAIERELSALRARVDEATEGPDMRTSVMTHMAWAPPEWIDAARGTLAGLADRHPSRTILFVPEPDADDGLDADVRLQCFPLEGQRRHVCSEVIELHLRGKRAVAPASLALPLLISDLPAFLRWRGQPPFGAPEFEQLVDVADRLVVDSGEWEELPGAYGRLVPYFERTAVSDIAWARAMRWRREMASLWPGIAQARELRVAGPRADALVLAGWLRGRLRRQIELVHEEAEAIESVAVDGEPVQEPRGEAPTASELLSDELDRFERDPIYEEAVAALAA